MCKIWFFIATIFILSSTNKVLGQEDYVVNQAKFLQKFNPSSFGMNQLNRVGVLYNSLRVNEASAMDNKMLGFVNMGIVSKSYFSRFIDFASATLIRELNF